MKRLLLFAFLVLSVSINSQNWIKTTNFMGLDAFCSNGSYIGTNDGLIQYSKTTNEWKYLGPKGHKITAIITNFTEGPDTIIVGTETGIYFSPDFGETWEKSITPDFKVNMFYRMYSSEFIACTDKGVFRASAATKWTLMALQNKNVKTYVAEGQPNSITGFVCDDGYYYIEHFGEIHKPAKINEGMRGLTGFITYFTSIGGYKTYVATAGTGGIYVIRTDSLYFGVNPVWERRGAGIENKKIMWFKGDGKNYTVGAEDGMYTSQDSGRHFAKTTLTAVPVTSAQTFLTTVGGGLFSDGSPVGFSNIQTIQTAPDGSVFIGTNGYGIYKTSDKGLNWIKRNEGLGNLDVRDIEFASDGKMYAATRLGAYVSTNNGLSWTITKPETLPLFCLLEATPKDGQHIFVSAKNTFHWIGTDYNWNGGVNNLNDDIYTIRYNPKMNMYLAAGRWGLWKSETQYVAWWKISTFPTTNIIDLEIDVDGRILALTAGGVYFSDNNGTDWQQAPWFPSGYKTDLAVDKNGNYFVAAAAGVFYSSDRGLTWNSISTGFANLPYSAMIDCLELDNENYMWAGSTTTGVYRSKMPVTNLSGIKNVASYGKQMDLQVFYNQQTRSLSFTINNSQLGNCNYSIYDINAKVVEIGKTFVSQGSNVVVLNKELNKGIYLLQLQDKDRIINAKFVNY